jgi:hypothetical protein
MQDAPFVEAPVAADTSEEGAVAARKRLQTVQDELNPVGGKTAPVSTPKKSALPQ